MVIWVGVDIDAIIHDLELDPERDYQTLGRRPGPAKGTPQRGGRRKKTPPA